LSKNIQINELDGYNKELESARKARFREFIASSDAEEQRNALDSFASLTSLRSATFINAYDEALGLQ
jgi:hypothetical protein